jgi:hypothetical protein
MSKPTRRPVSETGQSFGPQLAVALGQSPKFTAFVQKWRAEDRRPRRAYAPERRFADFPTLDAMRERVNDLRATAPAVRPFAHEDDLWNGDPAKALDDHARGVASWARRLPLQSEVALVAWLRETATTLPILGPVASLGGAGSAVWAYVNDSENWSQNTRRKAFTRFVSGAEPDDTIYGIAVEIDRRLLVGLPPKDSSPELSGEL